MSAQEIAASLSPRAAMLIRAWDHDPDAFVDAFDEVEAAGLVGDQSRMPQLNALGLKVRAILATQAPRA